MSKYRLITISLIGVSGDERVEIQTSHGEELSSILSLLNNVFPHIKTRDERADLQIQQMGGCDLHNLKGEDMEVAWYLMRYLCDNGWEPFATDRAHNSMGTPIQKYHFRKVMS